MNYVKRTVDKYWASVFTSGWYILDNILGVASHTYLKS